MMVVLQAFSAPESQHYTNILDFATKTKPFRSHCDRQESKLNCTNFTGRSFEISVETVK
jgi:hypothetical protein